LWAVQNSPSLLHRLEWDGTSWAQVTADGWATGKQLFYPAGNGGPDSEGVTRAESDSPAIYVATERDNTISGVSRLSILRFDTSAPGATLIATHEWNVTADLPVVGANLGLEAITWIPDSYLVTSGLIDASTGFAYAPAQYPNHGSGVFFVGVEATGSIHAFVLDHVAGGLRRIASIASGQAGTMGLEFDRDRSYLWSYCDDTCGNRSTVLTIDTDPLSSTRGQFRVRAAFERPGSLPNANHEGIAIAPETECTGGFKSFFWADDSDTGGQSIRRDAIPCATLF
jgi:hypothetical protein